MILQALNSYYQRVSEDPDASIPVYGTSVEGISYALVLSEDGRLSAIEDLREIVGKKLRPRRIVVPAAEKKASGIKPNFLWDTTSYVLGLDDKGNEERTQKCHDAFIQHVKQFSDPSDPGLKAVISFLDRQEGKTVSSREDWEDICGSNLVFRLEGIPGYVHEREAARKAWNYYLGQRGNQVLGQCLVSGEGGRSLARLHPSIKGVRGAQTAGASMVSFNQNAFISYGKEQSFNAPVSENSAFSYTTALNYLLSINSRQKIIVGDTTYVFWAKKACVAEDWLAGFFDPPALDEEESDGSDDKATAGHIHGFLKSIRDGRKPEDFMPEVDRDVSFYILGLAPNAARLSIRYWQETSLGSLLEKISEHYTQLEMVRQFDNEPEFPPLWRLLVQTATLGKSENISPVLAGGLTRTMLTGSRYPLNLLPVVLDRIRAERSVTYFRAALLKAYLLRNTTMEEVPVSLNPERKDIPYVLGRLFAVLEKAQEEAIPGTNATIKDRYLAASAATPGQVFHMLLMNSSNHLAKLRKDAEKRGRAIYLENMIQDISNDLDNFPKTQSPEHQGLFMIGYYHQRKDFFTKKQEG